MLGPERNDLAVVPPTSDPGWATAGIKPNNNNAKKRLHHDDGGDSDDNNDEDEDEENEIVSDDQVNNVKRSNKRVKKKPQLAGKVSRPKKKKSKVKVKSRKKKRKYGRARPSLSLLSLSDDSKREPRTRSETAAALAYSPEPPFDATLSKYINDNDDNTNNNKKRQRARRGVQNEGETTSADELGNDDQLLNDDNHEIDTTNLDGRQSIGDYMLANGPLVSEEIALKMVSTIDCVDPPPCPPGHRMYPLILVAFKVGNFLYMISIRFLHLSHLFMFGCSNNYYFFRLNECRNLIIYLSL
jgi:hypothetical protein